MQHLFRVAGSGSLTVDAPGASTPLRLPRSFYRAQLMLNSATGPEDAYCDVWLEHRGAGDWERLAEFRRLRPGTAHGPERAEFDLGVDEELRLAWSPTPPGSEFQFEVSCAAGDSGIRRIG